MTITDLILNFRAALLAVIPMAEKIGMPWRRGDAYDEWDELASCIYRQLVVSTLIGAGPKCHGALISLPAYDMMLVDYGSYSTVGVHNDSLGGGHWVFHAFGTSETPLDMVEVRLLNSEGLPCSDQLHSCPLVGSQFSLKLSDGVAIDRLELVR